MKIKSHQRMIVNESLIQVGKSFRTREKKVCWYAVFQCRKCSSLFIAMLGNARRGGTCGCAQVEYRIKPRPVKHGLCSSKVYLAWASMKSRCTRQSCKAWENYGGRGISVCERWLLFENFLEDMGIPENGMTLERIDNNSGYSPENCRWATVKEQRRNTRRNILITYEGRTQCLSDWAGDLGFGKHNLSQRMKAMTFEEAISYPVKQYERRKNK